MAPQPDFTFHRTARSPAAIGVLLGVWGVLLGLWLGLNAAWWIIAMLAAFTLPLLLDLIGNPASGLTLSDTHLNWYWGKRSVRLALKKVDYIRFDTRLDLSVRITAYLTSGDRVQIPYQATPPHTAFEAALNARNITTQRHHFTFLR